MQEAMKLAKEHIGKSVVMDPEGWPTFTGVIVQIRTDSNAARVQPDPGIGIPEQWWSGDYVQLESAVPFHVVDAIRAQHKLEKKHFIWCVKYDNGRTGVDGWSGYSLGEAEDVALKAAKSLGYTVIGHVVEAPKGSASDDKYQVGGFSRDTVAVEEKNKQFAAAYSGPCPECKGNGKVRLLVSTVDCSRGCKT
jgi:hypothetical protein